jgi:hypothetical protein
VFALFFYQQRFAVYGHPSFGQCGHDLLHGRFLVVQRDVDRFFRRQELMFNTFSAATY